MATSKPRITITIEPDDYAVLQRMARLQRRSMSRIVTELLHEVAPVLSRVADALEASEKAQEGMKAAIRQSSEQSLQDMLPLVARILGQFDQFAGELERLAVSEPEPCLDAGHGEAAPRPAQGGVTGSSATSDPRSVITGATGADGEGRDGQKGCTCTVTEWERMEDRTCPVHAVRGADSGASLLDT